MRTTAIFNLKGGVAKSTTTVNMAAILAEQGFRVLVIDADPQANTSMFYGFLEDPQRMSLAQLLDADAEGRSDLADDYVFDTPVEDVRLVPASMDLIDADISSIRRGGQIRAIRDLLDNLNEDAWIEAGVPAGGADAFDFVLIDCPPSFTAASVAAIYACDDVVIQVEMDLFGIFGMAALLKQIESVRSIQPRVRIAGALITKWHNSAACVQCESALRASSVPVFRQVIRRSEKVTESLLQRQSLQSYSPQSAAGRDYRAFVAEFLEVR